MSRLLEMKPHAIIVPLNLYTQAMFLLHAKEVCSCGNYSQYEYNGAKEWRRNSDVGAGNAGWFPRESNEFGIKIKTTKAMRKRGHDLFYYWREWNDRFPRAMVGRPC